MSSSGGDQMSEEAINAAATRRNNQAIPEFNIWDEMLKNCDMHEDLRQRIVQIRENSGYLEDSLAGLEDQELKGLASNAKTAKTEYETAAEKEAEALEKAQAPRDEEFATWLARKKEMFAEEELAEDKLAAGKPMTALDTFLSIPMTESDMKVRTGLDAEYQGIPREERAKMTRDWERLPPRKEMFRGVSPRPNRVERHWED